MMAYLRNIAVTCLLWFSEVGKGGIHSEVFPASGTDEGDNGILLYFGERYVCWSNECEAMHLKSVIIIMH